MEEKNVSSKLRSIWQGFRKALLDPSRVTLPADQQLQGQMLSAFLLLSFSALAMMALNPHAPEIRRITNGFAAMVFILVYALRWTGYYWLKGGFTILVVASIPFANTLLGLDPNDALKWLCMSLLLSGLWLPVRGFVIVFSAIVAGVLSLPLLIPGVTYANLTQVLVFIYLISFLIIVAIVFRTWDRKRIEEQTKALEQEIIVRKGVEAELQQHKEQLEELVEERTAELRESQRLLQGIMDHATAVIYVKDRNGRYVLVNNRFETIFRLARKGIIGKTDHELFSKKIADVFRANDLEVLRCGKALESEETAVHEDGSLHSYISLKFPLAGSNGAPNLLCGISTDITSRKGMEEDLKNALSEVKELKNRLQAENVYLQEEIKVEHNFEEIVSQSRVLTEVLHQVEQAGSTDVAVLILGETGTGKELLARALHNISSRKDRPLVKVNCATLPENLIESELFGHEKGAFTGASDLKIGRFELASGGTIFLDEVGDLPLCLQAKLLRVLQEGEIERLGSHDTIKIDTRVIAATNHDLAKEVGEGKFRGDLYYRLNVFPITCPPLRERKDDIPLLVRHFIKKHGARLGKKVEKVFPEVMVALRAYEWPGNIRELENLIERALITSPGEHLQLGEWFEPGLFGRSGSAKATDKNEGLFAPRPWDQAVRELKKHYIATILKQAGGVQKRVAEMLHIQPTYLSRLIKELEISS